MLTLFIVFALLIVIVICGLVFMVINLSARVNNSKTDVPSVSSFALAEIVQTLLSHAEVIVKENSNMSQQYLTVIGHKDIQIKSLTEENEKLRTNFDDFMHEMDSDEDDDDLEEEEMAAVTAYKHP